jgi:aminoglycoside/choline kinase family phosphotransferase
MSDLGREGLAAAAGVDSKDRRAACSQVLEQIETHGLETVRLAFADQHGVLRGKTLMAAQAQLVPDQRLRHDLDTSRQGHLAPHRVSGVAVRCRS